MIRTSHDLNANALYVYVTDLPTVRTEQLDSGTLVDLAEGDVLVGIEVLNPARPWPIGDILARFSPDEPDAKLLREMFGNAQTGADTRGASQARQSFRGVELASA